MNYPIEFISALIFFSGLVVVYNIRTIIENDNKTSYNYITSGLAVLSLCSLASVLAHQSGFAKIPFLNIPIFFQLCYWIGMITGLTMLLTGVSSWLPIYQKNQKYNRDSYNRIELFKKIEQLTRFENRNNVLLLQAIELIRNQYNFTEVSCFLYSQKNREMNLLGAVAVNNNSRYKSQALHFNNLDIAQSVKDKKYEIHIENNLQENIPELTIPMQINDKLLGAICFYSEKIIDENSKTNLKLVLDILARKIYNDFVAIQNRYYTHQQNLLMDINKKIDSSSTIKYNLRVLKNIIQTSHPIDYLSISFPFKGSTPKYIVSENNQILEDLTNKFEENNELEKYVLEKNVPVIINNLDKETNFIIDITALQNDIKSVIAYPIRNSKRQLGVIVLGSKQYNAYSTVDFTHFEIISNTLETLVLNSQQELIEKSASKRYRFIKQLLHKTVTTRQSNELYQRVSDFIYRETSAAIVRVSTFDKDERFLNSQVMTVSEDSTLVTPADATMMLMIMPSHKKVLEDKKTIIVDSKNINREIALLEQRQVFGDSLNQMIITPFYSDDKVVGIISIGYKDKSFTYDDKDLEFIEEVASILTMQNKVNNEFYNISNTVNKVRVRSNKNTRTTSEYNQNSVQKLLHQFENELVEG